MLDEKDMIRHLANLPPKVYAEQKLDFIAGNYSLTREELEKKVAETRNGTAKRPPVEAIIRDLDDYLMDIGTHPPAIIEGLLYKEAAHQFMGTIKAGKTLFTLLMIQAILHGQKFLGLETTPTNILYVSEQPRFSFQRQLRDAKITQPANSPSLYILDLRDLGAFDWPTRAALIRETAAKADAGLVCLDTFVRLALIEEINDAGEANAAFEKAAPIVIQDKRAILLNWHERKSGGTIVEASQGSVAHGGCVDMLLRLQRAAGQRFSSHIRNQ